MDISFFVEIKSFIYGENKSDADWFDYWVHSRIVGRTVLGWNPVSESC